MQSNNNLNPVFAGILSNAFPGPLTTTAFRGHHAAHPGTARLLADLADAPDNTMVPVQTAEDAIDPSRAAPLPTVYVGNELSNKPISSPGEDAGAQGRTAAPVLSCGSIHEAWVAVGRRIARLCRATYVVHTAAAPIEWDYLADSERVDGQRRLVVQTVRMTAEMEAHVLAAIGQVLTQTRITLADGTRAYLPTDAAIVLAEQIGDLALRNLHDAGEAEVEAAMNPTY